MSIIGKKVFHTSLNGKNNVLGTIVDGAEGICVDIQFENDSAKSRKYELVGSFLKTPPILYTDDTELLEHIESVKSKYYCTNCGKYHANLYKLYDMNLCPDCKKYLCRCNFCGKSIVRTAKTTGTYFGWPYCKDCFAKEFLKCDRCGRLIRYKDIRKSQYISDDVLLCSDCIEIDHVKCDICKEYFGEDSTVIVDSRYMCKQCYETSVGICQECAEESTYLRNNLCPTCQSKARYRELYSNPDLLLGKRKYVHGSAYMLRDVETIPFMSTLTRTDENKTDHVILENYISCWCDIENSYRFKSMDLVITREIDGVCTQLYECGCTMTELKTDPGGHIRKYLTSFIENGSCWDIKLPNSELMHLFTRPYRIQAVTYKDTNYGGYNWYGDTSTFFIIGALEKG